MKALVALGILSALLGSDEKKLVPAVCPVDGTKFTAIEIAYTNQWGGLDADFCAHAFKTTPLEYYVWTCPACGFTGRKKDYGLKLADGERQALKDGLKPCEPIRKGAKQSDIPGHVKYDLLAQVARIRGGAPEELGRAWLHAAWSCRQQGAVDLDDFDEWEALRSNYGLQQTPLQLGKKNRTEFELEVARKVEKDIEGRKYERGVNRTLARYLAAHLFRRHGENAEAVRWLQALETMKGENSVVDDAAGRMRASIDLEREYQKKALEAYAAALQKGLADPRSAPEIHYLAGELHRRTGSPAEASAAYQKALDGDGSPALKDLTRRQKALVEK